MGWSSGSSLHRPAEDGSVGLRAALPQAVRNAQSTLARQKDAIIKDFAPDKKVWRMVMVVRWGS